MPVVAGGTPAVLSGSILVCPEEVQSGAGTRPRRQCNAKACSTVSPTTLPMVVSHSIMTPPLCLPHSYYEVACLKKTKKGGEFFFYMYIHGVQTIQICFNGSQHDTVNSHHRVEFVGGN